MPEKGIEILPGRKKCFYETTMIVLLAGLAILLSAPQSAARSDTKHSSPAGLRWEISDDSGWVATYQRLGVPDTIETQASILFVEVVDGKFIDDSELEVHIDQTGHVIARRLGAEGMNNCTYTGQIENSDPSLHGRFGYESGADSVTGVYTCESE